MSRSTLRVARRFISKLAAGLAAVALTGVTAWAQPMAIDPAGGTLDPGQVGVEYSQIFDAQDALAPVTWSISAGSLPPGFSLVPVDGEDTQVELKSAEGGPSEVGTYAFTLFAIDDSDPLQSDAQAYTLTIGAAPVSIDTALAAPGVAKTEYSFAIPASGGYPPYSWTLLTDPDGLFTAEDEDDAEVLALSPDGVVSGQVTAAGNYSYQVGVTDSQLGSAAETIFFNVAADPVSITTTSPLPTAFRGVDYLTQIEPIGGEPGVDPVPDPSSYAYTLVTFDEGTGQWVPITDPEDDPLPPNLSLNAGTGEISGMPAADDPEGTYEFTVEVVDTYGLKARRGFAITVQEPQTLVLETVTLPGGQAGVNYEANIVVSGGVPPFMFAIDGDLPAGLSLAQPDNGQSSATISGLPTTAAGESATFTVTVTDSKDPASDVSGELTIDIAEAAPVVITTTELPSGPQGGQYNATIGAAGGVPGQGEDPAYTFTLYEQDGDNWVEADPGDVLPTGLGFNANTGAISGVAQETGTWVFQVSAADGDETTDDSANQQLSITITAILPLEITSGSSLPPGAEGVLYALGDDDDPIAIEAAGGFLPYSWAAPLGGLPDGLSINANTGVIEGTPAADSAGSYNFTVQVQDAQFTATAKDFSIIIVADAVAVGATDVPAGGQAGVAYSGSLSAVDGLPPYSWALTEGALPDGVSLASDGNISGTPQAAGTFTFTAEVTDQLGGTDTTDEFEVTIDAAAELLITTDSPIEPEATVGEGYSKMLAASGGVGPYSFALTAGSLPAGLTLTESGEDAGEISGTPTMAGTSTFTVQVTDNVTTNATKELELTVGPANPLAIETETLPAGTVRVEYKDGEDAVMLEVSGGLAPYSWMIVTGNLPDGLSLTESGDDAGMIAGTPTAPGESTFTVRVTDSQFNAVAEELSIEVSRRALVLETDSLAGGAVAVAYEDTVEASGGYEPYTFGTVQWVDNDGTWEAQSVDPATQLPDGLTLDTATGAITGTPNEAGTFELFFEVVDDEGQREVTPRLEGIELAVAPPDDLELITTALPGGQAGVPYEEALEAAGGYTPYVWVLASGALPDGLTLDENTGVIAGMPTVAGMFGFTIQLNDQEFTAVSRTLAINVTGAATLEVVTAELTPAVLDTPYEATLMAAGGIPPYGWAIADGTLPEGLMLDPATGIISGTPTALGTSEITVAVTDAELTTAARPLSLVVETAPLVVVTEALPNATYNEAYDATLEVTGGLGPYTWAIAEGMLPDGIVLDPATGVLSGTPTAGGMAELTVQVTDSLDTVATQALTLTVDVPALVVETTELPVGVVPDPYEATLAASGGIPPYVWAIAEGTLPDGLSLDVDTGVISGTPTAEASSPITVAVTDSQETTATQALTLTIAPQPLSVATTELAPGIEGQAYEATLAAVGGTEPYNWAIVEGALPEGLTLDAVSGVISGTPAAMATAAITVEVTDAETSTATQALTLEIAPAELTVTTTELPEGMIQESYEATLMAAGGTEPYSWGIIEGSLPGRLVLNAESGVISGVAMSAGTTELTVEVTDSADPSDSATMMLTLVIKAPLMVETTELPGAVVGEAYETTLVASGGTEPYTWAISEGLLPDGLILSPEAGTISGTPSTVETASITVEVTDSEENTATQAMTLAVTEAPVLEIETSELPGGTVGEAYEATLTAINGTEPYSWGISAGALPDGLSLAADTGIISGTPNLAGPAEVTFEVTDADTDTAIRTLVIDIAPAPLVVDTTELADGEVDVAYEATLAASGGTEPYTWAVTEGTLPAGLTLAADTGIISGTPTEAGESAITVEVTDADMTTATAALTITVTGEAVRPDIEQPVIADGTITITWSGGGELYTSTDGVNFEPTGNTSGSFSEAIGTTGLKFYVIVRE